MKRRTTKRTAYYAAAADDRNAWRAEQEQCCFVCGSGWKSLERPLEVHELASRAQAPGKSHARWSYCLLCSTCHAKVATIGLPKLLAAKALRDAESYDREAVNVARGREPNAVSEIDVIHAAVELAR